MQLVNFQIDSQFTSLIFHGKHFNLENNFEFPQLSFDEIQKTAELIFTRQVGKWVPENDPDRLRLHFKNVREYYQKDQVLGYPYPDEYFEAHPNFIFMIALSSTGEDIIIAAADSQPHSSLPAMILVFGTGMAKKIVADSVELFVD